MNHTPFQSFLRTLPASLAKGLSLSVCAVTATSNSIPISSIQHLSMTQQNVRPLKSSAGSTWTSASSTVCHSYLAGQSGTDCRGRLCRAGRERRQFPVSGCIAEQLRGVRAEGSHLRLTEPAVETPITRTTHWLPRRRANSTPGRLRCWEAGVDLLLAATLPAISEATGLASALAATGKPYMVSFVVRREGTLLDGTPLKDAIVAIDATVNPNPLAYR